MHQLWGMILYYWLWPQLIIAYWDLKSTVGEEPLFLIVVIHNSHILYALEIILTHRTFIHSLVTLLRSTHEYEQCCLPHRTLQYIMCIVASLLPMKQTSRLSMSYFDDVHGSSVDRNLSCFRNAIIMLVRYQHVNYIQRWKVCVHSKALQCELVVLRESSITSEEDAIHRYIA